jgi:hypothetical protein
MQVGDGIGDAELFLLGEGARLSFRARAEDSAQRLAEKF